MMSSQHPVNRRQMLRLATGASAAALLAACGGSSSPNAPAIGGGGSAAGSTPGAATSAPAGSAASGAASASTGAPSATTMYILNDKTFSDVGGRDAAAAYNQEHPAPPTITMEDAADGWDAKVLPQIKDKSLRWSGNGYIPFFDQYIRLKAGIVAPLDDYLSASKIPWAHQQKDVYFTPRIYEAQLLDGKQYYIPMKANVHLAGYRLDYVQAAGYDSLPKTWDEIDKMLPKMKAALAKDQVIPFSLQRELFRCVGTTFSTFIEKPLDAQGVFQFETPEWFDMIGMFKKWIDAGLARFDAPADATDAWQKGKFGMSLGSHSWVRLGRQVWGPDKVKGSNPPQANASAPARTWCHVDSGCVFVNAPYPQQATDFLLSIYGPEGKPAEAWWKGTLSFSGSPVFQSMIDKYVKGSQEYKEIYDVLGILPNSQIVTVAQANGYAICQQRMPGYLDRYFSGELSAKDAMAKLRVEVNGDLAKQKA